jgi:hypothetical protein
MHIRAAARHFAPALKICATLNIGGLVAHRGGLIRSINAALPH